MFHLSRCREAKLSFCNISAINLPELMITKLESFDIQQNSFGPTACSDQNNAPYLQRRAQENKTCNFKVTIAGSPDPCELCVFPLDDNVSTECAESINLHCLLHFQTGIKLEETACFEHLDLVLGAQCDYSGVDQNLLEAFTTGITQGRDGKGAIMSLPRVMSTQKEKMPVNRVSSKTIASPLVLVRLTKTACTHTIPLRVPLY
jgi:hypothetical protein